MTERHWSCERRRGALPVIVLAILFCSGGPLFAVDWSVPSGTLDYKMVSLSYITPERGLELMAKLGAGTVSRMPGTSSLLVTGETGELRKALAVLAVIDSPQQYDIAQLGRAASAGTLPTSERIADAVGHITIGTFANPPRGIEKAKALIDMHGGFVVAVAPVFQLQEIKLAVELGPEALKQRKDGARYAQAGPAAPTLQATDLTQVDKPAPNRPAQPVLSKEIRDRLRELQNRTPDRQAHGQSAPEVVPQPVAAAAPAPELAKSRASLGQVDNPTAEPNATAAPTPAAADAKPQDLVPAAQTTPEPVAADPVPLQPGQVVPPAAQQTSTTVDEPSGGTLTTLEEPADKTLTIQESASQTVKTETPASSAQGAVPGSRYKPPEFPNGDQVINLTLPEKLPVIELLDLVGKYLNLSYVYDPAKVTGEVTLKINGKLQGSLKVKELYLLLESVLQFKELIMTQHEGNIVKIVPKSEYTNIDPPLVTPDLKNVEAGDAIVTRVFTLKHVDTMSVENLLQQMGLSVGVTSVAASGTVIVTAYSHRMDRVEKLLEIVDKPGAPRQFKFRQLRYTMAQSLAEKVKALAEQLESVTVTVGGGETSTTTPSIARLPNESEAAWRARLVRIKAAEAATRARVTSGAAEPKPGVYLDADERTNRILMIGGEDQLRVVEQLVETLDVEQQDLRRLELYRIRHVDADEVARKLQELGIISKVPESSAPGRITGSSRTTSPTAPGQPRPATPTPEVPMIAEVTEGGIVGEPQVVVVESTNSLLVNATDEQHATVATIIEYVDSEMDVAEIPYKIYPLENSTPGHLAEVFESLIQETIEQQNKEGKIEKTVVGRDERVKIVPDPNTYSLVVYASKKNQEWISTLIKQLDKRRPQVLIDVTLVEVTKTDQFTYDLQLIESWPNLLNVSGQVANMPAAVLDKLKAGEDHFVDTSSTSGTFKGYYADRHVSALLTAMQSKNYGRVLAKPKLLVNDNEAGTIKTADITYIEKTSAIPVNTGTAGTEGTLIQTSKDFQDYEAGIQMQITPHISEGNLLRLVINLERSDFREKASPDGPPNKTTSNLDTAVTVPDGATIILGGMVKLNQSKGGSKVPILGDIPLIGGLFRTINNSDIESKLYVFVKAEIIRPASAMADGMEDLQKISEVNRTAFEKYELEFQNYQDWPGVKSRPVNPSKVLDAN